MNYKKSYRQVLLSAFLTIIIYLFYSVEFIRESVEDLSFDIVNQFVLSSQNEKLNAPNLLLFKIDDNYLKEKNLLDKNNETNYGYLFPRKYLADFVTRLDTFLEEVEKENYPQALFIDYDVSYTSDPHNKELSLDDKILLEILGKNRKYTIYLPKTSSYNFIEKSSNNDIQKAIKEKRIVFVSVGLTESNDNVSRRYYPYEEFYSNENKKIKYPLVDIELFRSITKKDKSIYENFSQKNISLIENRIIFKSYEFQEEIDGSEFIQSKWENFKIFSANYELESIIEENFANAVIYLGGAHSNSDDVFVKDTFDKELSGIEMHGNALMTLFYFDGKLNRLNLFLALLIICPIILLTEIFIQFIANIFKSKNSKIVKNKKVSLFIEDGYIMLTIVILFFISYYLLTEHKVWFNWLIPSLMTTAIPFLSTMYNFFRKIDLKRFIRFVVILVTFQWLIKKINKTGEKE